MGTSKIIHIPLPVNENLIALLDEALLMRNNELSQDNERLKSENQKFKTNYAEQAMELNETKIENLRLYAQIKELEKIPTISILTYRLQDYTSSTRLGSTQPIAGRFHSGTIWAP